MCRFQVADAEKNKAEETASKGIDTFISNAQKTRDSADAAKNKAEEVASKAAQLSLNQARTAYETADSTFGKVNDLVRREYDKKYTVAAQDAFNKAEDALSAANDKYGKLNESLEGLLRGRNDAIGSVTDYIGQIKGSLKDVTNLTDAKQAQTLLSRIQTSVNNTKLTDLINPVNSMISEIDPLKMAAIPKVNIQGANPDVFSNIDPNTGLPILDQCGLDSVLDRYKSNKIDVVS